MVSASATAVASKASAKPSVTVESDASSFSGVTPDMAPVIPKTVPKNPKIGIAHVMNRVSAALPSRTMASASARVRSCSSKPAAPRRRSTWSRAFTYRRANQVSAWSPDATCRAQAPASRGVAGIPLLAGSQSERSSAAHSARRLHSLTIKTPSPQQKRASSTCSNGWAK